MTIGLATTDLSDANPDAQVADPLLRSFGGASSFHGPIETLSVFEDNSVLRRTIETPGNGRVLVVEGGGSRRCALVGDRVAADALANGWVGIIVHGCVRDTADLGELPIGILALDAHPRRSAKEDIGEVGVPVSFAGIDFRPSMWVYVDEDGLIAAESELSP